jgi:hypothetical protein
VTSAGTEYRGPATRPTETKREASETHAEWRPGQPSPSRQRRLLHLLFAPAEGGAPARDDGDRGTPCVRIRPERNSQETIRK